jgi:hypothetical protein
MIQIRAGRRRPCGCAGQRARRPATNAPPAAARAARADSCAGQPSVCAHPRASGPAQTRCVPAAHAPAAPHASASAVSRTPAHPAQTRSPQLRPRARGQVRPASSRPSPGPAGPPWRKARPGPRARTRTRTRTRARPFARRAAHAPDPPQTSPLQLRARACGQARPAPCSCAGQRNYSISARQRARAAF